jgi:hypothetical protein
MGWWISSMVEGLPNKYKALCLNASTTHQKKPPKPKKNKKEKTCVCASLVLLVVNLCVCVCARILIPALEGSGGIAT